MPFTMRVKLLALVAMLWVVGGCGIGHAVRTVGALRVHTFTRSNTNVHVLQQGAGLVMIDSGYERDAAALDAAMRDEGLDPRRCARWW
jgi:glyoxylase-like metal-dependent hydrolase (beta-lactamase superfamily II)